MATDAAPVRFNGVVGMALRRWYIVVVGLLVSVPLAYLAAQYVAPTYTMKASIVLLPPEKSVGGPGGNPYLALGNLDAAVDVLAGGLSSDEIEEQVAHTGATSGVVERDGATAAPVLLITVQGPDKQAARAGVATLVAAVPTTLASIQQTAGVADNQRIRSEVIASSKRALVSYKPQLRAALEVLIAGMALTFVAIALVESLAQRRRRRRSADTPGDDRPQLQISGRINGPESDEEDLSDLLAMPSRKR